MFGVRAPISNDAAEPAPSPRPPNKTSFGIHVLDDEFTNAALGHAAPGRPDDGPRLQIDPDAPATGGTLHGGALKAITGGLGLELGDARPVGTARPVGPAGPGVPGANATFVGRALNREMLGLDPNEQSASPGRPRTGTPAGGPAAIPSPTHTAFGIPAVSSQDDPVAPVGAVGGGFADDWLDDIQSFIDEKVADGSLDIPSSTGPDAGIVEVTSHTASATLEERPPQSETETGQVAGFGIVRRKRTRRAESSSSSAPVATAGSADRRALEEESTPSLLSERVVAPDALNPPEPALKEPAPSASQPAPSSPQPTPHYDTPTAPAATPTGTVHGFQAPDVPEPLPDDPFADTMPAQVSPLRGMSAAPPPAQPRPDLPSGEGRLPAARIQTPGGLAAAPDGGGRTLAFSPGESQAAIDAANAAHAASAPEPQPLAAAHEFVAPMETHVPAAESGPQPEPTGDLLAVARDHGVQDLPTPSRQSEGVDGRIVVAAGIGFFLIVAIAALLMLR